jgi:hypothetical protein
MDTILNPICIGCQRTPDVIPEYVEQARVESQAGDPITATQWCLEEEGTLNPLNGHFLCTECYIRAGMPVAPGGWKAP